MVVFKKYHTCLISCDYAELPDFSLKGRGWYVTLDDDRCGVSISNSDNSQREIVIHAVSSHVAQNAMKLIIAAAVASEHIDSDSISECEAIPEEEVDERRKGLGDDYGIWGGAYWPYLTVDVAIAAKASHRRAHQYALHKYRLSKSTARAPHYQLNPDYWTGSAGVSKSPADHVHSAYAIILAYSVIEELGLEIRATQKNPRRLSNGDWNPLVRENLEQRLRRAHVPLDRSIIWYYRGTPTRIERKYQPPPGQKANWAYAGIRDIKIDVCDAIDYASRLRSRVSSHRLHDLSASLTHFDVENVQGLARYLLITKLGFWRRWAPRASQNSK